MKITWNTVVSTLHHIPFYVVLELISGSDLGLGKQSHTKSIVLVLNFALAMT